MNLDLPEIGDAGPGYAIKINAALLAIADDYVARDNELAVQYAAPWGDNDNDGLWWDKPKLDVYGAYDALPYGGTIYFADDTYVDDAHHDRGFWLMGGTDPNYASPPAGWRQAKKFNLVGVGNSATQFQRRPAARLLGGSPSDTDKPLIWLSDVAQSSMADITSASEAQACFARIGVDSTGNRASGLVNNLDFTNVGCFINQALGNGPAWDLGFCFWINFDHCVTLANAEEDWDSNLRAAYYVSSEGILSSGLIHWNNCVNALGGGIQYYPRGTGWEFTVSNLVQEGSFDVDFVTGPGVWLRSDTGYGNNASGVCIIDDVQMADTNGPNAVGVRNDCAPAQCVQVRGLSTGWIGPVTVIGGFETGPGPDGENGMSILRSGSVGFSGGSVIGQHNSARRSFAPVAVRATNLAAQDVSTWGALVGTATVTTGKTAPNGQATAAQLASASGRDQRQWFRGNRTFAVGDYVVGGVWARGTVEDALGLFIVGLNTAGFTLAQGYNTGGHNAAATLIEKGVPNPSTLEWVWQSFVASIETIGTNPCDTYFAGEVDNGFPVEYFAPVLLHIPAADMTINEAWELANHMQSWPDGAPQGSLATLLGQPLYLPQGYVDITERADPAAPAANTARYFVRDNGSGKTQFCVRFPTGAVQVIATEP